MYLDKIRNRVKRHEAAYYETVRGRMQAYATLGDIFPHYLKGSKRVSAILGRDGIVVSHWSANEESFSFMAVDKTVGQVVADISGPFGFEYPPGTDFDLQMAQAELKNETTQEIVWRAPWDRLELSSKLGAGRWSEELGRASAMSDVLSCVSAHLMTLTVANPNEAKDAVLKKLEETIDEFKSLLEGDIDEEDLQQFLTRNPILLTQTGVKVIPRIRLGSEFVTDFVIEDVHHQYVLVEIEPSGVPVFTERGDPSARLSHAQRQVEDWREWVHENIAYARNSMPGISEPEGWIIIGRRTNLSESQAKALARKNAELQHITIMTYDDLIDRAEQHLRNLESVKK